MKRFIKALSIFLVACLSFTLFACNDSTSTKKGTTKNSQTKTTEATKTKATTKKATSAKTSTKSSGDSEFYYLTIDLDDSADTTTLKNTIKVVNLTTETELSGGDSFKENDRLQITLFNCASDVKIKVVRQTNPEYDIYPLIGYDQLTGSDATTGQEPFEIVAQAAGLKIVVVVDDGSEIIEYGKFYISNTATNATTRFTHVVDGYDTQELSNGSDIIVNETIYGEVENKSTTEIITVATFTDNQLDEVIKLNPGERTTDIFFPAGEVNNIYIETYTTFTITSASSNITMNKNDDTSIASGSAVDKYTIYNATINNESENIKIFKVTSGSDVLLTMIVPGNDTVTTDNLLLTSNVTLTISEIEGPKIDITAPTMDEGAIVSVSYIYGSEETDKQPVENGDKIPLGYSFEVLIYLLDESYSATVTVTIGEETIIDRTVTFNSDGITITDGALVATDDIVVIVTLITE